MITLEALLWVAGLIVLVKGLRGIARSWLIIGASAFLLCTSKPPVFLDGMETGLLAFSLLVFFTVVQQRGLFDIQRNSAMTCCWVD